MDYFVYKTKKEKQSIMDEIKNIRNYIYGDEDITPLEESVSIIPYEKIKDDRSMIQHIKRDRYEICNRGDDWYFKCYDDRKSTAITYFKESIMTDMMINTSGSKDDLFLPIFYNYIYSKIIKEYINGKEEFGINEELGHLGLLAFSNEYNPDFNNDLVMCALYSRNQIKKIYEEVMGEGSLNELINKCNSFNSNQKQGSCTNKQDLDDSFYSVIGLLKEYFHKKLDMSESIPQLEKEPMLDNFDEVYNLLVEKYENEKGSITKPFLL